MLLGSAPPQLSPNFIRFLSDIFSPRRKITTNDFVFYQYFRSTEFASAGALTEQIWHGVAGAACLAKWVDIIDIPIGVAVSLVRGGRARLPNGQSPLCLGTVLWTFSWKHSCIYVFPFMPSTGNPDALSPPHWISYRRYMIWWGGVGG